MTKKYLAWVHKLDQNTCSLYHFEGFDKSYHLKKGIRLANEFPDNVYFDMNPDRPHETLLVDSLYNTDRERVISASLMKFLTAKELPNLEFLPVKIMDHKGKFIEDKYFIMNVLDHQDCLDYDASEAVISRVNKKSIKSVEQIVLIDDKVDDSFDIFRICDFPSATLVEENLAKELEDNGFSGLEFLPLDEFDGM